MNVEQQNKAVGKLVDEMLGMPVGLPHALRRSAMCGAIHKFLTTQDTGGGDGLLRQTLQYNLGVGDFNFSKLPYYDRNNAAFDAWAKLKGDIEAYLATRTQDTGERERLRTMYRYGYADNGNGVPSDPELFISAVLKAKEGKV